jgi:hypothetical protein
MSSINRVTTLTNPCFQILASVQSVINNMNKVERRTFAYVQICLEQADDLKIHVTEQVPHAALAITPRIIDAKVHRPNASI